MWGYGDTGIRGYMGIYGDIWGYMGIYEDIWGYMGMRLDGYMGIWRMKVCKYGS